MANDTEAKYRVFVSYCQSDGLEYAKNVKQVLEGAGYQCFVSDKDMDQYVGKNVTPSEERILSILKGCEYFVLILTHDSLKSSFIQREIATAISENKSIFPYYKKPDLKSSMIKSPYSVNKTQRVKFITKEDLAIDVLQKITRNKFQSLESFGIKDVFENRHSTEYGKAISEAFSKLQGGEVRMLGISFRDWFGEKDSQGRPLRFSGVMRKALEQQVRFKVLLIDPTSDIARERAVVECGAEYANDSKYVTSPLFDDINRVSNWIKDAEAVIRQKNQQPIDAHFYDFMLSIYAIITPTCTFVEQYHIGSIGGTREPGDESAYCLGGYVPVFMVYNSSHFGTEISDHFNKIWDHTIREEPIKGNTFPNVIKNMEFLKNDPTRFRLQQFTVKTYRRSRNLLDFIRNEKEDQRINSNY